MTDIVEHMIELPAGAHHGIKLFAEERVRVVDEEGYTIDHDQMHDPRDLIAAGYCYIQHALLQLDGVEGDNPPYEWPFGDGAWKPSEGDTLKDLKRGVQFLAAFVDHVMTPEDE